MKPIILAFLVILLLVACQPGGVTVTILDGEQVISFSTSINLPSELLTKAQITLGEQDSLYYLGAPIALDAPLPEAEAYTLTVRRAVDVTIITPESEQTFQTSAPTVGQALVETGYDLYATDFIDPSADTPISGPLTIHYRPGQAIVISVDGIQVDGRSAAATVGEALVETGIPLMGLDYSIPAETSPIPVDGRIRVVRVVESVELIQTPIPYSTRSELSADIEIDQQELIQGGEPGLAVARIRTRSEDGEQISQETESETIVRPPQDQVMGYGTKIVIRTATVDGVTFEYWRALNLKATSYSPCESDPSGQQCLNLTYNGTTVTKGVVAMVLSWFNLFENQHLYIPGYGEAVVADVGGGWPNGNHYWVDLGWSDEDYQPLTYANGIMVYFLTPVPANPGYILP